MVCFYCDAFSANIIAVRKLKESAAYIICLYLITSDYVMYRYDLSTKSVNVTQTKYSHTIETVHKSIEACVTSYLCWKLYAGKNVHPISTKLTPVKVGFTNKMSMVIIGMI